MQSPTVSTDFHMPSPARHRSPGWCTTVPTPFGVVGLAGTAEALTHLAFQEGNCPLPWASTSPGPSALLAAVQQQLAAYCRGCRHPFTLPLAPVGTAFQQRVWQAVQQIPFGTTVTYQEIARRLGTPTAARAVGHANGRNPLAILIPCHRLLGSDGQLRGYAGGISYKRRLLQHEGVQLL